MIGQFAHVAETTTQKNSLTGVARKIANVQKKTKIKQGASLIMIITKIRFLEPDDPLFLLNLKK